jgi:hypothetical protein
MKFQSVAFRHTKSYFQVESSKALPTLFGEKAEMQAHYRACVEKKSNTNSLMFLARFSLNPELLELLDFRETLLIVKWALASDNANAVMCGTIILEHLIHSKITLHHRIVVWLLLRTELFGVFDAPISVDADLFSKIQVVKVFCLLARAIRCFQLTSTEYAILQRYTVYPREEFIAAETKYLLQMISTPAM